MSIALVAHTSCIDAGASSAIDTTGANFLVAVVGWFPGFGGATFSDSYSNTWTELTQADSGSGTSCVIYYCASPTVGAGHTFTPGPNYAGAAIAAFSGVATSSPFDRQNGAGVSTGFSTSLQPGSVTPGADDELLVVGLEAGQQGAGSTSVDSSFAITDTAVGTFAGVSLAYLVQTAATAENPTWTFPTTTYGAAAVIATFTAGGGGGGNVVPLASYYNQLLRAG